MNSPDSTKQNSESSGSSGPEGQPTRNEVTASSREPRTRWRWLNVFGHLASIVAIFASFLPVAKYYLSIRPAQGIDLYLSVTHLAYLARHFTLPFTGWFFPWYGGSPFYTIYPYLNSYFLLPLVPFVGPFRAVQLGALGALLFFLLACYWFFFLLSRNKTLALIVTVAAAYSANLYPSLLWSGSIPYFSTIFLLPLSLALIVLYHRKDDRRLLLLVGLLAGVFFLLHPQSFVGWTIPLTMLFLLFWKEQGRAYRFGRRIVDLGIFFSIVILIGLQQVWAFTTGTAFRDFVNVFINFLGGQSQTGSFIGVEAAKTGLPNPAERLRDIYLRSNDFFLETLIVLGGLFLLSILITRRRGHLWPLVPVILLAAYLYVFLYGFILGINPFVGGWFRAFWPVVVIAGGIIAVFWRNVQAAAAILLERLGKRRQSLRIAGMTVVSLILLAGGGYAIFRDIPDQQTKALLFRSPSSANPTFINDHAEKGIWSELGKQVLPSWIDTADLSHRFYDLDATVNIWLTAFFDLPLARGYLDPLGAGANFNGWQYFSNVTLAKDELVERFGIPRSLAANAAEFFLDWNAIRYVESAQGTSRLYSASISSYLFERNLFSRDEERLFHVNSREFIQTGVTWVAPEYNEIMHFYEVRPEKTSPIYQATDAPVIGIVGDPSGVDTMMRLFAFLNLHSRRVIFLNLGPELANVTPETLDSVDNLLLYQYRLPKRNATAAWSKLQHFVEGGKTLFIDTGTDTSESDGRDLNAVFPSAMLTRKPLGSTWSLSSDPTLDTIDLSAFGPPIFDGQPWSFSYPTAEPGNGVTVLLRNAGHPILTEERLGSGTVFWSGMNLPYHVIQYKSEAELGLVRELLGRLIPLDREASMTSRFHRRSPQKVEVTSEGKRGVLLKEAGFPGWSAKVRGSRGGANLAIYRAGPSDPGYLYVAIPEALRSSDATVTFTYHGRPLFWAMSAISFLVFLLVLDSVAFRGLVRRRVWALLRPIHTPIRKWWAKEDTD